VSTGSIPTFVVAELVAALLPFKRFLRRLPQMVCCNINISNIEQILPQCVGLGSGKPTTSSADLTTYPAWEETGTSLLSNVNGKTEVSRLAQE
jgi:hypothetical protein